MILISLTAAGVELIQKLAPIAWERQNRLLSGLSQQEAFRVIEILERNANDLLTNPDLTRRLSRDFRSSLSELRRPGRFHMPFAWLPLRL